MVNVKFLCISSGVVTSAIGIALIVLAALIVGFVNHRINDGVKDLIRVKENFGSWDESDIHDWKEYTVNYTYYVWNVTNLNAVLTTGVKPTLQVVGPFFANENNHRFNITWDELSSNPPGTVVSYNEWWTKVWTSDSANADVNNANKKVTSLNSAYFGVLGQIKATTGSENKESVLMNNFIPSAIASVKSTLTDFNSDFITLVRLSSFRAFLLAGVSTLSKTSADWANSSTLTSGAFKCWDLTSPSTDTGVPDFSRAISASDAAALFDPNSLTSLLNATGAQMWAQALNPASTYAATLASVYPQAFSKVIQWVGLVTSNNSYCWPTYQPVTVSAIVSSTGCTGATVFTDLGACQFGSGALTRPASNSVIANSATSTAFCNTLNGAFGASNLGFTCAGPEFYAFAQANCAASSTNFNLTVAEAKSFLDTFTSLGTAPFNPQTCATVAYTNVRGLLTYYALLRAGVTSAVAGIQAGYSGVGLNSSPRIVGGCMAQYLQYMGKIYGLIGGVISSGNGGVFTTRTTQEFLLGYAVNDPILATLGRTYTGVASSYSSESDVLIRQNQHRYRSYTGTDNVSKAGFFQAWRGTASLAGLGDVYRSSECPCLSFDSCSGACLNNTCLNIWSDADVIDGVSDASSFYPFQEGSDPNVVLPMFNSDSMRVLNFIYAGDTEVKGIKLRRYVLDPNALNNQTVNPRNQRYKMVGPNGIVWMEDWQGAPVYLSRPHFYQCDSDLQVPFANGSFQSSGGDVDGADGFSTHLDVEPLTGLTMRGHKRLQMAFKLTNTMFDSGYYNRLFTNALPDYTSTTPNTTKALYWPLFWADQNAVISDSDAHDFRTKIYDNRDLADRLEIAGYVVGSFLTVTGLVMIAYGVNKKRTSSSNAATTKLESTNNLSSM